MKKPSAKKRFSFGLGLLISVIIDFFHKKIDKDYFLDGVCMEPIIESESYMINDDIEFLFDLSEKEVENPKGLPPLEITDDTFNFDKFKKTEDE